ncbi:MAG: gliding motility protein GldN [Bacteroidota bacterium]|jgi:gliding motility associated protien GldN
MKFNFLSFLSFVALLCCFTSTTYANQHLKLDSGSGDLIIASAMLDDSTNSSSIGDSSNGLANGGVAPLPTSKRMNGVYERKIYQEKQVIPYEHIREGDVFWQKRIWRLIDAREKMNQPFKYKFHFPNETFFDMIHRSVLSGEVTAFEDEDFITTLPIDKVKSIGAGVDTVPTIDVITGEVTGYEPRTRELNYDLVNKFRIKEDWFFDEETSTMQVRILGISPILDKEIGGTITPLPMYWIYYPDIRKVFARKEIFNPKNDAVRMTWEDIMEFRYFSSYIIKESNVYDRTIASYSNGIDALLEGERVKNDIFNFEHDLWSY